MEHTEECHSDSEDVKFDKKDAFDFHLNEWLNLGPNPEPNDCNNCDNRDVCDNWDDSDDFDEFDEFDEFDDCDLTGDTELSASNTKMHTEFAVVEALAQILAHSVVQETDKVLDRPTPSTPADEDKAVGSAIIGCSGQHLYEWECCNCGRTNDGFLTTLPCHPDFDGHALPWIYPLRTERAAALTVPGEGHENITRDEHDNVYSLGRMGQHNVAISYLTRDKTG